MIDYYPIELFHWAGMKDEYIDELKDILAAHPEYVHETNKYGDNCLFIAVKAGNINMVKYIVEETDININHETQDKEGNSDGNILLAALSTGNREIINYLLSLPTINIYSKSNLGETIYHLCGNIGDGDLMEKIIEIDPNKKIDELDKEGRHCLFNVINTYKFHKDYWCFDIIQENLSEQTLLHKDIYGMDVLQFCKSLQEKNPKMEVLLSPLLNILKTRV